MLKYRRPKMSAWYNYVMKPLLTYSRKRRRQSKDITEVKKANRDFCLSFCGLDRQGNPQSRGLCAMFVQEEVNGKGGEDQYGLFCDCLTSKS